MLKMRLQPGVVARQTCAAAGIEAAGPSLAVVVVSIEDTPWTRLNGLALAWLVDRLVRAVFRLVCRGFQLHVLYSRPSK